MNKLMIKKVSIGRSAIIQGSTSAGNIKLFIHKTSPYFVENLNIIRIFLFQTKIRHTCIEIIGTNCMSKNFLMLLQRNLILIVIQTVLYAVTKRDRLFRKLQITLFASGTIHFHKSHIMGRANCSLNLSCAFCLFIQMLQIICCSGCNCKKAVLACNSFMYTGRCKHMSKVVYLEIVNISHSGNAVPASFSNDLLGGKIAVRLLCSSDQVYIILNFFLQKLVICLISRINGRFHPFIKVSVSENSSVKISLRISCADFKVLYYMADILAVKHMLQLRHSTVRTGIKAFLPKTACPFYFHPVQRMNLRVWGSSCICQHGCSPLIVQFCSLYD